MNDEPKYVTFLTVQKGRKMSKQTNVKLTELRTLEDFQRHQIF